MGGGDFIEINCPMFFTFYEAVKGKIKGQKLQSPLINSTSEWEKATHAIKPIGLPLGPGVGE